MDFGIAETEIARGSLPVTTTKMLRVGFPFAKIRFVSDRLHLYVMTPPYSSFKRDMGYAKTLLQHTTLVIAINKTLFQPTSPHIAKWATVATIRKIYGNILSTIATHVHALP
jgi:hypothetical protein